MVLDCGATSLSAIKGAGLDPNDVAAVVVTHLHGDHFGGVPFLVLDGQFRRRTTPLRIVVPAGGRERVEQAMEVLFPGSGGARRRFDVTIDEVEPGTPTPVGDATLTTIVVRQPGTPACAVRLEYGGRTVAFTGDTEWTDELPGLVAGADLLIAEAYRYDTRLTGHLDYATLEAHRDELACRRVLLTHLGEDLLARQDELAWESAHEGLVIEV